MIGVTLESKNPHFANLAEIAKRRFMHHTGLNCIKLATQANSNYSAKLQLWKLFHETNQSFVFFDGDNWAVNDVDLREFDNRKEFFAVTDSLGQRINPGNWLESFTRKDADKYGIPLDQMVNGGFWIAHPRHHRRIFERALEMLTGDGFDFADFGEQSSMSKAIYESDTELHLLPVEYNAMCGGSTPMSEISDHPYFIHAAGVSIEKKAALLRKIAGDVAKK